MVTGAERMATTGPFRADRRKKRSPVLAIYRLRERPSYTSLTTPVLAPNDFASMPI
jgi:hypothetical protein